VTLTKILLASAIALAPVFPVLADPPADIGNGNGNQGCGLGNGGGDTCDHTNNGGQGGAGGSANNSTTVTNTQAQTQTSESYSGSSSESNSSATGGNATGGNASSGGNTLSNVTNYRRAHRQAPGASAPTVIAGQCQKSISLGFSTPFGGVSGGGTRADAFCQLGQLIDRANAMGRADLGCLLLYYNDKRWAQAMAKSGVGCPPAGK
jgi:hypothetical protein